MAEKRKVSAPSSSKQHEFEQQNDCDVEKIVDAMLTHVGIKSDSIDKDKLVFWNSTIKLV